MKQKYIFHLKIYIFFQSCLVLKTDSLGCQCCQCREPINDLVSGVVLKRKLDVGFAPFSLYRKGNRHSFSKYDGNRSQFSRDIKNIPVNLSRSTDISIKISPTRILSSNTSTTIARKVVSGVGKPWEHCHHIMNIITKG